MECSFRSCVFSLTLGRSDCKHWPAWILLWGNIAECFGIKEISVSLQILMLLFLWPPCACSRWYCEQTIGCMHKGFFSFCPLLSVWTPDHRSRFLQFLSLVGANKFHCQWLNKQMTSLLNHQPLGKGVHARVHSCVWVRAGERENVRTVSVYVCWCIFSNDCLSCQVVALSTGSEYLVDVEKLHK